eukprot:1158208-Pelagomonas_calceolata.AAC.13
MAEERMAKVQGKLDEMQAQFDAAMAQKQALEDDATATQKKVCGSERVLGRAERGGERGRGIFKPCEADLFLEDIGQKAPMLANSHTHTCTQMDSATALINALAGEEVRWTNQSKEFDSQIQRLTGDCALASGFVSYLGPFNKEFRELLIHRDFLGDCQKLGIPVSEGMQGINDPVTVWTWFEHPAVRFLASSFPANLSASECSACMRLCVQVTKFLVDDAEVGEWTLQGLPTDELSIQNGIMVTRASRYPVLVDPQGQVGMGV